jgi:hypothetical protein
MKRAFEALKQERADSLEGEQKKQILKHFLGLMMSSQK